MVVKRMLIHKAYTFCIQIKRKQYELIKRLAVIVEYN